MIFKHAIFQAVEGPEAVEILEEVLEEGLEEVLEEGLEEVLEAAEVLEEVLEAQNRSRVRLVVDWVKYVEWRHARVHAWQYCRESRRQR